MIAGLTIIRRCSACSQAIEQRTIASGNTFGATFWTDGKREAPMLPDRPKLIACPHCHALLWIDQLKELAAVDPRKGRERFVTALPCQTPRFGDYLSFLRRGALTPDKERYVRVRAWWAGNDERRKTVPKLPLSQAERSNLSALIRILEKSAPGGDILMRAEALRELGRFDEVLALLAMPVGEDWERAAGVIRGLAEQAQPFVERLHFE